MAEGDVIKISQLPAATQDEVNAIGTLFVVVAAGVTKRATKAQMKTSVLADIGYSTEIAYTANTEPEITHNLGGFPQIRNVEKKIGDIWVNSTLSIRPHPSNVDKAILNPQTQNMNLRITLIKI